nr:DeoR/GlpR family DNA-binding transcription regulator [uncultured Gellertiella sp.]
MTMLRREGRVTVNALAGALAISKETIRRDLSELEGLRQLRKVHGGATLPEPGLYPFGAESPFQARMGEQSEAKRAIARAAMSLLRPGDTLFVDTGSTTVLVAEELSRMKDLTVITNSGLVAGLAARGEGARVIHLGGDFRADGAETLGTTTVEQIERYQVSHAIITVAGLTELGGQDVDPAEADVARAMSKRARQVIIVADSSKFYRGAPYTAVDMGRIDVLVCETLPEGALRTALEASGVELLEAAISCAAPVEMSGYT